MSAITNLFNDIGLVGVAGLVIIGLIIFKGLSGGKKDGNGGNSTSSTGSSPSATSTPPSTPPTPPPAT